MSNNLTLFSRYQQIITPIIMVFTIVDIIATIIIGAFALLAPNLNVLVFKREPTIVILLLIVIAMILLSLRPLIGN